MSKPTFTALLEFRHAVAEDVAYVDETTGQSKTFTKLVIHFEDEHGQPVRLRPAGRYDSAAAYEVPWKKGDRVRVGLQLSDKDIPTFETLPVASQDTAKPVK
jgi:hypothetical protein